ncbi:hypothetical protein BDV25DRAFT_137627 [Aspergillus avenaceus]|uniref:DUF6593 domain-containing protein n=1 Tax=Aspergillus avenaceus TaxID=36643 RepID=A0A5N6U226_ASPAV|nr:hypothetical protein BDV25DRAFT_137627 [Aspergillus avenaceus]
MTQPTQILTFQRPKSPNTPYTLTLQQPTPIPLYTITPSSKPNLTISRYHNTSHPPTNTETSHRQEPKTGTVTLSPHSSKITLTMHASPAAIKLKRRDFLASGHRFTHPRFGVLEWKETDLFRKRFKLVDANKAVLARFEKWEVSPEKRKVAAFLVYVRVDAEMLDWIVVSGLGVVEYRVVSDREWEEELWGEVGEGLFG